MGHFEKHQSSAALNVISTLLTQTQPKQMKPTTYRIKVDGKFFPGSVAKIPSGHLTGPERINQRTRKTETPLLEFASVEDADAHLRVIEGLSYDGNGYYSIAGKYCCKHGQYARPDYWIVRSDTGRSSDAIRKICDSLNPAR